jgi:flagellar biosynthesis protein FlhA
MLSMMVLPLPPFILDLLFTFNIALALVVMMVSSQMVKPLDFAALPTVLLVTTLLLLTFMGDALRDALDPRKNST